MKKLVIVLAVGVLVATTPAAAAIVLVGSTMNIFGASHPAPPLAPSPGTEGINPVLALTGLTAGNIIQFLSVTGTTTCGVNAPCTTSIGPDGANLSFAVGSQNGTNVFDGAGTGQSGLTFDNRYMFLVGVFLGAAEASGADPVTLVYTDAGALLGSYSPLLGQTFFVGDGQGTGGTQSFIAPVGATRLFLGFLDSFDNMDGFAGAYTDNTGELTVDVAVIPEPGTFVLLGLG
ncbi:MAG: hypothetical protein ACRD96_04205, partial [Bryobacteraceae bacterium]